MPATVCLLNSPCFIPEGISHPSGSWAGRSRPSSPWAGAHGLCLRALYLSAWRMSIYLRSSLRILSSSVCNTLSGRRLYSGCPRTYPPALRWVSRWAAALPLALFRLFGRCSWWHLHS